MVRVVQQGPQLPGLNCILSYTRDASTTYAFRCRVGKLQWGIELIADEAQGRLRRSFYPHRLTNAQFSLGLILDGSRVKTKAGKAYNAIPNEYQKFMTWMHNYMQFMIYQDDDYESELPRMKVSIPSHDFYREGVPLGPVLFGDHVGSMIWTPTIVFETTRDLNEPKTVDSSRFLGGLTSLDKEAQFFYPTSPQLSGDEAPFAFDQGVGGLGKDAQNNYAPTPESIAAAAAGEN